MARRSRQASYFFPTITMTEDNTPVDDTSSEGTVPDPEGTPGEDALNPTFKDDTERADHFQKRHTEATDLIQVQGKEKNDAVTAKEAAEAETAKYKEIYGDLNPDTPSAEEPSEAAPQEFVSKDQYARDQLKQALPPSMHEHLEEVKKLTDAGVVFKTAKKIVAEGHNITLGPSRDVYEGMPTDPGGADAPPSDQPFSEEELAAQKRDNIDPELAKKHQPAIEKAWQKALKR